MSWHRAKRKSKSPTPAQERTELLKYGVNSWTYLPSPPGELQPGTKFFLRHMRLPKLDTWFCLLMLAATLVQASALMIAWEYDVPEYQLPDVWFHVYEREQITNAWKFVASVKGRTNYNFGEPLGPHRFYTISAYTRYADGTITEAFAETEP